MFTEASRINMKEKHGMTTHSNIITVKQSDLLRGEVDFSRLGKYNPNDTEPRPRMSREDFLASKEEAAKYRALHKKAS
jgi:hypothetical protein